MKYNRLTLITVVPERAKDGHKLALWLCDCGTQKVIQEHMVRLGFTKSCGCLLKASQPGLIHGQRNTTTYKSWQAAKSRCINLKDKDWKKYGGKGITICDQWLNFENFYKDMGDRPEGTSLDRIDNTKNYEPGNCRWATRSEQQRNKTTSYIWHIYGKTFQTAEEAAVHFGVRLQSVWRWANGYKNSRTNKLVPPKPNCYRERKYA
jgi:hypothetical protein